LISTETNNVISRTNKGDPNILEIIVNLNYTIKKNNKILFILQTLVNDHLKIKDDFYYKNEF
jgi:hypothetical protein